MKFRKFLGYFFTLILIFGAYLFGNLVGRQDLEFKKGFIPSVNKIDFSKPKDIDFSLFWDVWNKIEGDYAGTGTVDKYKMFYGAISGMVSGLGDPYTVFLNPEDSKTFAEEVKGEFNGVGIEIGLRNNKITVIAPLDDSPAQEAGVRAGDVIDKIDGRDAATLTLDEAVNAIRGDKGSEVTLTISRNDKQQDFKLKRAIIKIKSVKWEMKEDNIAYLKISQFIEDTDKLSQKAASEIIAKKPKGIILDLRNNPGGYLDSAIAVSSLFIKDGIIAIEAEKDGKKEELKSNGNGKLADIPVIVLVNEGSASGSEIVAGAIQDRKRGTLIGEKTFGKGTVQSLEEFKDGSTLRLTVARWLTPNGRTIHEQGLMPDIEVKMTEDDINAGRDPQLERAIQELNK